MTSHEAFPWPDVAAFAQSLVWHDPQWTALHNRLHRPRRSWQGQFAGRPLRVQWNGVAPEAGSGVGLALRLGEDVLGLTLPAEALQALDLPPGLTPGSLAGSLLLEQALLGLIVPLEQLTGQPIRLLDGSAPRVSPELAINLGVQFAEGAEWPVQVQMSASAATLIAAALDRHAPATPLDLGHVQLPMSVDGGEAWLSLAELRSLLPGDVVMLDPWPDSQVRLHLGSTLQIRAQREGGRLQVLERPIATNSTKEHHMSEVGAGPSLETSLDELQLKLVCQVGSVELSLAQLRELGSGSLLQLTPQMQEGVELLINGRRVGQGQLVQIGDGLGVRLLSFATP